MKEQLKSPDLDHQLPGCCQNIARFPKNLLSSMIFSQIWRSPSSGWLPVYLPHKFYQNNPLTLEIQRIFLEGEFYIFFNVLEKDRSHAEVTLNFPRAQHATPESRAILQLRLVTRAAALTFLGLQFLPWGARERSAPLVSLPPLTPAISQSLPGSNGSKLMLHE